MRRRRSVNSRRGACGGGTGCGGGLNTNTIEVNPGGGQTLRLDIFLSLDETSGLIAHAFSLGFDTVLDNELNISMAPVEWSGTDGNPGPVTDVYGPFTSGIGGTVESTNLVAGRLNSYESASVTTLLPRTGAAYTVGRSRRRRPRAIALVRRSLREQRHHRR